MACGTGKTLTALWLHERLQSTRTLVVVPSLSLLNQTLLEWTKHATSSFEFLPVCSDETVGRGRDDDIALATTSELPYPVTTDPQDVRNFLNQAGPRVVFSTYHSSPAVADALVGTRDPLDLVIADEAHRCAGPVSSDFATVLNQDRLPAKKRVFMTATPRIFTSRVKNAAKDQDWDVASMDDEAIFGPVLFKLSFAEAIERNLLSDYRVLIVGIDNEQYRRYAEHGQIVALAGDEKTDARSLASQIGLAKAMRRYDLQRVITFHGRVKGARDFSSMLPRVIEWMPQLVFPGIRTGKPMSDMTLGAVLKRMGRHDLTVHGFRSTFRDWAAETTNFPREVCEQALAHTLADKVEAAYRRGDLFEKRRQLMTAWSAYCEQPPGAKLVEFPA